MDTDFFEKKYYNFLGLGLHKLISYPKKIIGLFNDNFTTLTATSQKGTGLHQPLSLLPTNTRRSPPLHCAQVSLLMHALPCRNNNNLSILSVQYLASESFHIPCGPIFALLNNNHIYLVKLPYNLVVWRNENSFNVRHFLPNKYLLWKKQDVYYLLQANCRVESILKGYVILYSLKNERFALVLNIKLRLRCLLPYKCISYVLR